MAKAPAQKKKSYVDFQAVLKRSKFTWVPPTIDKWIPTGLTLLDAMIANGFPGGRFAQIHGEEMTFKSAFTYHLGACVQQLGGAVWVNDAEDKWNGEVASINGLKFGPEDIDNQFYYTQLPNAEAYLSHLENWLEIARESTVPMLAIYDSIGVMSTKDQQESKKEHPMSVAKKLSDWFRTAELGFLTNTWSLPLWINQQRDNIDFTAAAYMAKPPKLPGGKALRFKTSLRLRMAAQSLAQNDKDKSTNAPIGKLVRFHLEKSCTSPDSRMCMVPYFYHFGFDDALSCLNYLIGMNYLKKGTEEGVKNKFSIEGVPATKGEWRARFYEDPGVRREIRALARKAYISDHSFKGGEAEALEDDE